MSRSIFRLAVILVIVAILVTSSVAGTVAADEHSTSDKVDEGGDLEKYSSVDKNVLNSAIVHTIASDRVRKAFLQAKKAFHNARQEIQAIKKGDESPVEDLPSFFGEE